jgi:hypothetical protein
MAKHAKARPEREPVKAEVSKRMVSLKGQSRSELERDDLRGASSPLGMGSHSKRKERMR